jgi:hypothetical protein
MNLPKIFTGRCSCGCVELETMGKPIHSVSCHCSDCYNGSKLIEALPNATAILDSYGGTQHLVFRKDRFRYVKGTQFLKKLKVDADSPSRVYASCCNSYLLIDLPNPMPAYPVNRNLFQGEIPPLEMRINAKFKSADHVPNDVPSYRSFPFKFIRKIMGAMLAMIFWPETKFK